MTRNQVTYEDVSMIGMNKWCVPWRKWQTLTFPLCSAFGELRMVAGK